MNVIIMMLTLTLIISCTLIFLNSLISKHATLDREKPSPFECGFDLKTLSRISFSIRFFLIAVIFLVFDVEITLILPLPLVNSMIMTHWPLITTLIFILILIMGLYHEWNEGSLQWK